MTAFTAGAVLTASALNTAFNTQTINAQTTSYTVGSADAGELITVNNNSGGTVTIPLNTTWGAATGTIVGILNAGTAGSWTIGTAAGVTLNASSTSLAALESGTLIKTATNTWYFQKGGGLPKATYSATTGSPTVTTVSGKTCLQFTGSGSITVMAGTCDILVVGGAGSGGTGNGGGGGAGGHLYLTGVYLPTGTHTITVGAGGVAPGASSYGFSGATSSIGSYYFGVGGGGGGRTASIASRDGYGWPGGSGGGGGGVASAVGGSGVSGQGNAGGNGVASYGGGGGGSGGAGTAGSTGNNNAGGAGTATSITGASVTRAAGGTGDATSAASGGANTGDGGGGSDASAGPAGAGGSGVVILLIG